MPHRSTATGGRPPLIFTDNRSNGLSAHSSSAARTVAVVSAVALVIASAGFGGLYAWNVGSEHGTLQGALTVLTAVALEGAKPLSLAGAFAAFGAWRIGRGLALALLATVAIGYSLTAELTLMAGARGDVVAQREAALKATADAGAEVQRARDRYESAKAELATMPAMRSVAEIQSEIGSIDNMAGIVVRGVACSGPLNTRTRREQCPRRSKLEAEKARSERRAQLEAVVAQPLPVVQTGSIREVHAADPGASALHTYLAALGLKVEPATLTEWLALAPVLALEIGSALAGLLAGVSHTPGPVQGPAHGPAQRTAPDRPMDRATGPAQGRSRSKSLPAVLLALQSGAVQGSQREIAEALGTSKSTVGRAQRMLAEQNSP